MTARAVSDEPPLLAVRGLTHAFTIRDGWRARTMDVLHGVSFDVRAAEVVGLVGESGSGKSTTARLIARLVQPSAGEIYFKGEDVLASQPRRPTLAYRARVQLVFQDPFSSLNPLHTIRYLLSRPLLRHGKVAGRAELESKVRGLLETVGLTPGDQFADKYPHQLSGGQRQRVALARALAVDPELILADEPTSMLDISIRIDLLNLMRDLKSERQIGYLFITHDLGSARYFADRILVIYAGQIVESARSETLLDSPAHPYTRLLVAAVPGADASVITGSGTGSSKATPSPGGCAFAARCPSVMDRCRQEVPAAREVVLGHMVRCHLY